MDLYRSATRYFTMVAAVLYGAFWVVTTATRSGSPMTDRIDAGLFTAVVLGGVAMGVTYVLHRFGRGS